MRHVRVLSILVLLTLAAAPAAASDTPTPSSVTIAGSLQSEIGCDADWDPACEASRLAFDPDDLVWQGTFAVPAGTFEYKAALDGGWAENYGANARRDGANIPLALDAARDVKFYYSHETHWITSDVNARIVTAPGSFQDEIGCPGDWQPDCLRSWLQDPDGDGVFVFSTRLLPAGSYEVKAAVGESWAENYGVGGTPGGANIPFTVPSDGAEMFFVFTSATNVLEVTTVAPYPTQPDSVTVAGSLQSELGCPGDWQPDCAATQLAFDPTDEVWQGTFAVPAGAWEYKAALNGSWDENYGANATRNGPNIGLSLAEARPVKFYYSHDTHWVADNVGKIIAVAPGSFQSELGCPGDWQPDCLRSWLQDPDGDGIYTFATRDLRAGNYETKVAIGESWDENYGAGGVPNGPNIAFSVPAPGTLIVFTYDPSTHVLLVTVDGGPRGNLGLARAHWVAADTIAWNAGDAASTFLLHGAPDGDLQLTLDGVTGGTAIPLTLDPAGLPAAVTAKFPHLAAFKALKVPSSADVPTLLRGQLAVSAAGADGKLQDATSVQIPGVLDDLYAHDGPLGIAWDGRVPTLRVWAPTARKVDLLLYADADPRSEPTVVPMTFDAATGTWSATGTADWRMKYYQYEVTVWARGTGKVETNRVTDPYSVSLSRNSRRSQIVDLDDRALEPPGWKGLRKPPLRAPNDVVLYELHVRDFSANDASVAEDLRGTYLAFARPDTNGMRHLRALSLAGLTHVHLLPVFDITSVDEDKSRWQEPQGDLGAYPADSDAQQAAVTAVKDADAFNWGYDPFHFMVPEGSYASETDGAARVREFRAMVQGLARAGLRVVMDSVFNHTSASGQAENSVLDRIVPGYYHRYNLDGNIERSTCCENTATEHAMMEKLMVDALLVWAKAYRVDGFRFDLMGHHMKRNMLAAQERLHALTPQRDGVDGASIYLYGEGWNFGEVADGARGVNAVQRNMAGTGIGTFNDRIRDAARGGGPFSGLQVQGFLNGLALDPNGTDQGSPADQLAKLLLHQDQIRVGLAGNLADFPFVDRFGAAVTGADVDYNGQPTGYTEQPQETINYVSAHDNETLFDAIQLKAPVRASMDERVRMQNLGISLVGLAQGVPFFHAGDELLRSKSMDRDSYNSGDWFNKLDFTYRSNNWGVGLPPAEKNEANWPIMQPLLADAALMPEPRHIRRSFEHFLETLAIRKSTGLFRLGTAEEIGAKLRFHNTGAQQVPGLIVMSLSDRTGEAWGTCGATPAARRRVPGVRPVRGVLPDYEFAVVLFNAGPDPVSFTDAAFAGKKLQLHPVLAGSHDDRVRRSSYAGETGTFEVPGRTTAVFVCTGGPRAIVHRR